MRPVYRALQPMLLLPRRPLMDDVDGADLAAIGVALFLAKNYEAARTQLLPFAERKETAAGASYFLARIARALGSRTIATTRRKPFSCRRCAAPA